MRHLIRVLPLLLFALLPFRAPAATADTAVSTDRVIIKWRAADSGGGATDARVRNLAQRLGQPLIRGRAISSSMSVLHLPSRQRGRQLAATLSALRADPNVELAAPDRRMRAQGLPNDPLFIDYQWYLQSAEPSAIRAAEAWDISRGGNSASDSQVVIAVLDTGVRPNHPDLKGKLLPGFDFVSDATMANDGDQWDDDPTDPGDWISAEDLKLELFKDCERSDSTWHGTRVSGLIGAEADNGSGIAGTGFHVRLLPVRVLGKCGGYESDVIAGMYWAAGVVPPPPVYSLGDLHGRQPPVNPHPAQIINLSLGGEGECSEIYAVAVREITAAGVLVVVSAGNDGGAVTSPGNCPGALAVAGLRHAGTKVGYSNLGSEVGIAAPAGNCLRMVDYEPCVYSLNTTTNLGAREPGEEGYSSPMFIPTFGTSFSSPLVAGTAGLMKALNPALTPTLLIARIKSSARPFPVGGDDTDPNLRKCVTPAEQPLQDGPCQCNTDVCGAGMLDALGAVQEALRPAALAQMTGVVRAGNRLTLDGSQSTAANGRSIVSWQWSVESSSSATAPVITNAGQAIASIESPLGGSTVLRLDVRDNTGASDSARITITGAEVTSSSPPSPPPASTRGGGGDAGTLLLPLLALLGILRLRAKKPH